MGVDIQTYRARIGTYKHSRCGKTIEHYRIPSGSHVAALVTNLKVSNDIKTVGCVFFIGILLMIAGVEPNPGPMEMGSDSYYSDEEPEVVKGAKKSVNALHVQSNDIGKLVPSTRRYEPSIDDGELATSTRTATSVAPAETEPDSSHNNGTTSIARAETEPDSSRKNEDKNDAEIELTRRKMQGTQSSQTTGATSDARAETEPDSSHKNESKLKDAPMFDLLGVWKWKRKFKNVESWKSTMVNIAVTGMCGAGKSSFINSIRGLKPNDVGAAACGVHETTFTCNRYEHPANKSFIFWDLPGIGTPNFPKEQYLQKVSIDRYDFFIIISNDRFPELDLWLTQKIRERKKSCFFVRSHIDVTIGNDAREFSKMHNETILLQTIRNNISKEFQSKGISDQKIFLISNYAWNKYDFGKLNNELLSVSDGLQKEISALSLCAVTREEMEKKKKILTGRIPTIALSIASASTKSEQKELFKTEINVYRKLFNIDEETLSENREILFLTDDDLEDFRVVFDEHKQKRGMTMKTPTASMNDLPTVIYILDSFTWSKEKTRLYIFSEKALKINLELLYNMAKTFYDAAKFNNLVKKTST